MSRFQVKDEIIQPSGLKSMVSTVVTAEEHGGNPGENLCLKK